MSLAVFSTGSKTNLPQRSYDIIESRQYGKKSYPARNIYYFRWHLIQFFSIKIYFNTFYGTLFFFLSFSDIL